MNQHERFADDRFSEGDSDNRPVALPTRSPPAGDPGTDPKRGDDILPGQPEVAGTGDESPSLGGSAVSDATDDSRSPGGA